MRGLAWDQLRGTVQNDILKEHLARGNYIYPPEAGVVVATDLVKFCSTKVPNWNSMSISGYHIREAGSTAVQELAFTFANALEYIDALVRLGLNPAQFIGQLAFFFNAQIDFLEEIAKFRAARRIWSSLLATRYQVIDPDLLKLRFHTQTAGSSLTAQQPLNNLARTSIEAMAAILGGTQSLHTNAHDEALGLPTAASATSALRIQQIIAEESGVVAVADPLAGSYLIEDLTSRIEQEVRGVLSKIESLGGMLLAIKSGWAGEEIEKSAFAFQKEVEANERLIVGVNVYQEIDSRDNLTIQKIDAQNEQIQIQKLLEYKKSRDQDLLKNSLESLRSAAQAGSELMPQIVACVRAGATVGEISDILRSVYGLAH
jgi:methylmalonyl-CoA mutase N-terminal domain/subunit